MMNFLIYKPILATRTSTSLPYLLLMTRTSAALSDISCHNPRISSPCRSFLPFNRWKSRPFPPVSQRTVISTCRVSTVSKNGTQSISGYRSCDTPRALRKRTFQLGVRAPCTLVSLACIFIELAQSSVESGARHETFQSGLPVGQVTAEICLSDGKICSPGPSDTTFVGPWIHQGPRVFGHLRCTWSRLHKSRFSTQSVRWCWLNFVMCIRWESIDRARNGPCQFGCGEMERLSVCVPEGKWRARRQKKGVNNNNNNNDDDDNSHSNNGSYNDSTKTNTTFDEDSGRGSGFRPINARLLSFYML